MALPMVPLPRATVVVGDEKVEVRGLSRAEVMRIPALRDDPDALDTFVLRCGAGVSEEEAQVWRESSSSDTVDLVVDRIVELSGLADDSSKSDGEEAAEQGA